MNQKILDRINEIQALVSKLNEEVYQNPFDHNEVEIMLSDIQTYCNQIDWLERENTDGLENEN